MHDGLLNESSKRVLIRYILERLNRYEKYRGEEITFSQIILRQAQEIALFISGDNLIFKPYVAEMVKAKKIFCVVAYDIQDDRSRIQISKILEKYGTRINYSVFECMFTDRQFQKIPNNLERWITGVMILWYIYDVHQFAIQELYIQPIRKKIIKTVEIV